jgi:5-methyltetrahydropteroyltriglutamate--homocysteine methyltransferase
MERVIRVIPKERFWVNPDCGLKTRTVDEAIAKLRRCVEAAGRFRD